MVKGEEDNGGKNAQALEQASVWILPSPVIIAAVMSFSSVSVIGNAIRLLN